MSDEHGPLKQAEVAMQELQRAIMVGARKDTPLNHWEKVVPKYMAQLRDVLNELLEQELGGELSHRLGRIHNAARVIEKLGVDGFSSACNILGSGNQNIALALVVAHLRRVFGSSDQSLTRENIERINQEITDVGIC